MNAPLRSDPAAPADPTSIDADGRAVAPAQLRPMSLADLDTVLSIEQQAYSFPWSRGNFVDSLAAGYLAEVLLGEGRAGEGPPILGYHIALPGVDELHLLNLTVDPSCQGRGHARRLLDALERHAAQRGLASIWLEVRVSNQRARRVYARRGFAEVGLRKAYYPAPHGSREDAVVMSLVVSGGLRAMD